MGNPKLLYCVGAAKAGTSWLYRVLADRPDCALNAVKETHYWDTPRAEQQAAQIATLSQQEERLAALYVSAQEAGRGWQMRNIERRLDDIGALKEMLGSDRTDHRSYIDYLEGRMGQDTRLIADICPSYALLTEATFKDMINAHPDTHVLYVLRDPLARLWSAARMQAERQLQPGEEVGQKANNILWRIANRGMETHLTDRGAYAKTIKTLRRAVPTDQLTIVFMEELVTQGGFDALCQILGLPAAPLDQKALVHAGRDVELRANLRPIILRFLQSDYEFVRKEFGYLPPSWARPEEGTP